MPTLNHRRTWKTFLAFAIIYFVWGSTFLAIRIGVQEVPPFLLAAMRFLVAGVVLYGWMLLQGEPSPTSRQWSSAFLLAVLIFILDYGLVFWAEQRVPSGMAAVMMSTVAVFMALAEITLLRTLRLTAGLVLTLLIGIAGVAILVSHSLKLRGTPLDPAGAVALIVASISWAFASVLNRKVPLPRSKVMSSAVQMLAGGVLLALAAAARGELRDFHPQVVSRAAWYSLLYMIVAGSLLAFTAYIWLLHHESPTNVGTHAYVNPVVAVVLGYFFAGEPLGMRTILGTACVLLSVLLITTGGVKKPVRVLATEDAG